MITMNVIRHIMPEVKKHAGFYLFLLLMVPSITKAQDAVLDTLPVIIENKGQLRTSDNNEADSVMYYGRSTSEFFFWKNNFDLVLSHFKVDSTETDSVSVFRYDLKFLNKDNDASYTPLFQDHYLNYYRDTVRGSYESVDVYKALKVGKIYKDIDLVFAVSNSFGFTFNCAPGSEPDNIKFAFNDSAAISTNGSGGLSITTPIDSTVLNGLRAYQVIGGTEVSVAVSLNISGLAVSFNIGTYNTAYALKIVLGGNAIPNYPPVGSGYLNRWTTYLGGDFSEYVWDTRLTADNNAYISGQVVCTSFPVITGGLAFSPPGLTDAFVVKFLPDRSIKWGIFYGGLQNETAYLLEPTTNGDVIFTGPAYDGGLPLCPLCPGYQQGPVGNGEVFIARVNSQGKIDPTSNSMSTYFGGSGYEFPNGLALGENGSFYISGWAAEASLADFPYLSTSTSYAQTIYRNGGGANNTNYGDGFIAKFDKYNKLIYCTAIGGYDNPSITQTIVQDLIGGLAVDERGDLYATGTTASAGVHETSAISGTYSSGKFPVVQTNSSQYSRLNSGGLDAVLLRFSSGGALEYSTEFGGELDEAGLYGSAPLTHRLIAINSDNDVFIGGNTQSYINSTSYPDFPIMPSSNPNSYNQTLFNGTGTTGLPDGFIAKFNDGDQLEYSTYIGGTGFDVLTAIACKNSNKLIAAGYTQSVNFPIKTQSGYFSQSSLNSLADGFVFILNNHNLNHYYSSYFGGDNNTMIFSVDSRSAVDDDFLFGGIAGHISYFPFANPAGNIDYFTTGSHTNGNAFVSNFTYNCLSCERMEDQNIGRKLKAYNVIDGVIVNVEEEEYSSYNVIESTGRIIESGNVKGSSVFVPSRNKSGIYLMTLLTKDGKRTTVKFFIDQ